MLRSSLYTAGALLICTSAFGQTDQTQYTQRSFQPITAPTHNIEGSLDLRTGKFTRTRNAAIADDGKQEVYDNTCTSGFYIGLEPSGSFLVGGVPHGSGSAFPEAVGDYGAIPSTTFNAGVGTGDAFCTVGCADDYDITAFEIAWCQLAAPVTGAVIELHFWDTPQDSCQVGTDGPINGMVPPQTTTVLSATITGLPRNNMIGTLECYVLTLTLVTPGFNLQGSNTFSPGGAGDKFAWSFSMPTSTGSDGPIIAGNLQLGTPCLPCEGTIWEVGGQTTNQGTGGGQENQFFWDDYGGTSVPSNSGDCYGFGGGSPPAGFHLELFADKPCIPGGPVSVSFCNSIDGSTTSCPCAAGSNPAAGCDTPIPVMQGGGLTGGVQLTALAQETSPANGATLGATGFPSGSTPGAVLMRSTAIAGSPTVFGDGIQCVANPIVRIGGAAAVGGSLTSVFGHGTMAAPGTYFYQIWFRSAPASYCDPIADFNLGNGVSLNW